MSHFLFTLKSKYLFKRAQLSKLFLLRLFLFLKQIFYKFWSWDIELEKGVALL